jgi:nicotinamidase-related amidase
MRILKDHTSAMIIDMQEKLFPYIFDNERLTRNTIVLIEGLKVLHVPIFVTEQYVQGLGPTIAPIVASLENRKRTEKMAFSCCDEPAVMEELAVAGKENIVIAGIESHVCVLQTVIDLKRSGYNPVVVTDCISSRNKNDKKMAIERMKHEGATLTTYEAILFEILRYSGTDQFKAISKLVK